MRRSVNRAKAGLHLVKKPGVRATFLSRCNHFQFSIGHYDDDFYHGKLPFALNNLPPCASQSNLIVRRSPETWLHQGACLSRGCIRTKIFSESAMGMARSVHHGSKSCRVSELQEDGSLSSFRALKHCNIRHGSRLLSASETDEAGTISPAKVSKLQQYHYIHHGSKFIVISNVDGSDALSSIRVSELKQCNMHPGNRCISVSEQLGTSGSIRIFKRTHMGHSHDHHEHDQNDDSAEAVERVCRLGLIADICLSAGKGFAGYVSGSTAVVADAAHSMSDIVLSGVALWVFKAARAPKDQMHPYGHGKFETLGALGISSMLLLTGGGIAWHAFEVIQGLLSATDGTSLINSIQSGVEHASSSGDGHSHRGHHHGFDKEHQAVALSATLISICVKEGLFWATKRVGDARGSELLKANAWHHRSDAISSVIALLGVGGAMLGWHFLDPLAGVLVSGLIIRAGVKSGYRSLQELVDSALPESVLSPFKATVMRVKGVKGCHAMRGRRAGSSIHLDVHIEVDPSLSVSGAHMIGETARQNLREHHSLLEEIFIHVEPAADAFSRSIPPNDHVSHDFIEKAQCISQVKSDNAQQQQEIEKAVRALVESDFAEVMAFERIRCHFLQGRLLVELEVSMEPTILIRDAMQYAQSAEEKIMDVYPKISAIETQLRLTGHL